MSDYREVATKAALEAGDLLVEMAKRPIEYTMKNARDIQAKADLKSEQIILEKLKKAFPGHSILSEEAGEHGSSDYLWIVDPIDGTINYARGIEEYCISIALSHKDQIIVGLVYQPVGGRLFVAEKGKGAFLNDKKIRVAKETELVNCIAATDNTSNLQLRQVNFDILNGVAAEVRHVRVFGSGALHLARLADGQLDFYYKARYNYWDFAAGSLIVEEAGGKVTDLDGQSLTKDSKNILAASSAIHSKALELVGSQQ